MSETLTPPERIKARRLRMQPTGGGLMELVQPFDWKPAIVAGQYEYILSTPARDRAGELVEGARDLALKIIAAGNGLRDVDERSRVQNLGYQLNNLLASLDGGADE